MALVKGLSVCCACLFAFSANVHAQGLSVQEKAKRSLAEYFLTYRAKGAEFTQQPKMKSFSVNDRTQTVTVTTDNYFAQQDFTDKQVGQIYKKVKKALPKPYNKYRIEIFTNGMLLEDYVPQHKSGRTGAEALWGKINYNGKPWVDNVSRPMNFTHGLYDRHISLWASHGRYYDNKKGLWKWQRPNLFATTEDLFTQTIVVPFLIPMLENAGAVVFTPRERDWQTAEYIVDNDCGLNVKASSYKEYAENEQWLTTPQKGFKAHEGHYQDGENPFAAGTARMQKATKKEAKAFIKYQPTFAQGGRYAVYVSYQTMPNSIDDAHYTVFHKGQATEFRVNQQMGGGTWVYLGTFEFDKGDNMNNCVMLTNQSHMKGIVTADAVRFGGGMGNIERGGATSNYPRCLEGARYSAQWGGAPYSAYGGKGGSDDYSDDINTRSRMTNWLAGGSVYVPTLDGKNVPIELSLAVHSDAGFSPNGKDLVGSLAICTTDFNDGRLSSGITRQSSKLLAQQLLAGVTRDLTYAYKQWNRRYLWDRNYSETRLPEVPSSIIETLSHQNFPDMVLGQDPNFKFTMARSLYKSIVRYIRSMHGQAAIIEPLAPRDMAVKLTGKHRALLSWSATMDEQEPSATPTYYIVYTAIGNGGFDNGRKVNSTSISIDIEPDKTYHFKVTAANRGGESFPSETVSAYSCSEADKTILVINGFHRLSAPAIIDNGVQQGFDLDSDPGVSYGLTAGWNGRQQCFNMSRMGQEGPGGLGYGGDELAGHFIAGNDFNYIRTHTDAIASTRHYNVVSCSSEAIETGKVKMEDYQAIDIIIGLEKYDVNAVKYYKSFPVSMQRKIAAYTQGGGRMLVSGAYLGTDMTQEDDASWLSRYMKASNGGSIKTDTLSGVNGLGMQFDFIRTLNPNHYAATHADVLHPEGGAICAMQYSDGQSAAVAYSGNDYKCFVMGFPFECITDTSSRNKLMQGILNYILQ
jgi:hypothetical protein